MQFTLRNNLLFTVLFCLVSSVSSAVPADEELDLKKRDLDKKQAEQNKFNSSLNTIDQVFSKYRLIRDQFFYGQTGVIDQSEIAYQKMSRWIANWDGLINGVNSTDQLDVAEVRDLILEKMRIQEKEFSVISKLTLEVMNRAQGGVKALDELGLIRESVLPTRASQIRSLNVSILRLKEKMSTFSVSFNDNLRKRMEEVIEPTVRTVMVRLRKSYLSYPSLLAEIDRVEKFLNAEIEFAGLVSKMRNREFEIATHSGANRIFHAQNLLKIHLSEGQKIASTIASSSLDADLKSPFLENIEDSMERGKFYVDRAVGFFTKGRIVENLFKKEAPLLAAQCRDPIKMKETNCELLRTVLPLNPQQIRSLQDPELEYIEYLFDRVRLGPINPTVGTSK